MVGNGCLARQRTRPENCMETLAQLIDATAPRPRIDPKRVFLLMARHRSPHQRLADQLAEAGFVVRQIVHERIHPIWRADLRRGRVPKGSEGKLVKRLICAFLRDHGFRYPPREIDVLIASDRIRAGFIFEKGDAGCLSFDRGEEKWEPGYIY